MRLELNRFKHIVGVGILLSIIIVAGLYWPGLIGDFLLDDFVNIHPAFLDYWRWDYTQALYLVSNNNSGAAGRPVSIATFLFTGYFHGLDPWWYKYHNLLIHLLIGVLLYALGIRLAQLFYDRKKAVFISLYATLVWLLHPLFVSTVLYPVQRMAQLSSLFLVLSVLGYLWGRLSEKTLSKLFSYFVLVPLCGLLSVFSKENGALLPLFLLATELLVCQKKTPKRIDVLARQGLILLPIFLGVLGLYLFFDKFTDYSNRSFNMEERLITQLDVMYFYIGQLLFPRLSDMGLFLDHWDAVDHFSLKSALLLIVYVSLLVFSLFAKVSPLLRFGILWFFIGHLMESTLFPLELVFEHRNYLPAWGLFFALSFVLFSVTSKQLRKVVMLMGGVLLVFYSLLLVARVNYWGDSLRFASVNYTYHPNSLRSVVQVAKAYMSVGDFINGRKYLEEVTNKATGIQRAGPTLAHVLSYCHHRVIDEALFNEAVGYLENEYLDPFSVTVINQLVMAKRRGKCQWLDKSKLEKIIDSIDPKNSTNYVYRITAQLYSEILDYPRAMLFYHESFALSPNIGLVSEMVNTSLRFGYPEDALRFLYFIQSSGQLGQGFEAKLLNDLVVGVKEVQGNDK